MEASAQIADTYSEEAKITAAAELTERELAVLILYPTDREGLAHLADEYDGITAKIQKDLDLSVAGREGKRCSSPGCHTAAVYLIDDDGEILKACQPHLSALIDGACVVTLIDVALEDS
jgi:hypothetical protein